jgi:chromosome segregation ATPase
MKKEERDRTLGEYQKRIKDLEERLAMADANNSALCTDLEHWKRVATGLKGYNSQLKKRVEHYRALDLEGDELYEKKIAELEDAKRKIAELEKQIKMYTDKCNSLNEEIRELKCRNETLTDIIEYETTPWWKKLLKMFK